MSMNFQWKNGTSFVLLLLLVATKIDNSSSFTATTRRKSPSGGCSIPVSTTTHHRAAQQSNDNHRDRTTTRRTMRLLSSKSNSLDRDTIQSFARGIIASSLICGCCVVSPFESYAAADIIEQPPSISSSSSSSISISVRNEEWTGVDDILPALGKPLGFLGEKAREQQAAAAAAKQDGSGGGGGIVSQKFQEFQRYQAEEAQKRADKLREYDEMFDRDARERDRYYGAMAAEKKLRNAPVLEAEKKSTEKAFSVLDELKIQLQAAEEKEGKLRAAYDAKTGGKPLEKDQVDRESMALATALKNAVRDRKMLQRRVNLEASLVDIRSTRQAEKELFETRAEFNQERKEIALLKIQAKKEQEQEDFEAKAASNRLKVEEKRFENEQRAFEKKFDDLDEFVTRKKIPIIEDVTDK